MTLVTRLGSSTMFLILSMGVVLFPLAECTRIVCNCYSLLSWGLQFGFFTSLHYTVSFFYFWVHGTPMKNLFWNTFNVYECYWFIILVHKWCKLKRKCCLQWKIPSRKQVSKSNTKTMPIAFNQRNYPFQICYLITAYSAFHLQASVYYSITYSSRKTDVNSAPSRTEHSVQQLLAKKQTSALNTQKLAWFCIMWHFRMGD